MPRFGTPIKGIIDSRTARQVMKHGEILSVALLAFIVGLFAAAARLVLVFLPYVHITEALLFGLISLSFACVKPKRFWLSAGLIILPAMAFIVLTLSRLGVERLQRGVGTAHFYSAILIPVVGFAGAYLGSVIGRRRQLPAEHVPRRSHPN